MTTFSEGEGSLFDSYCEGLVNPVNCVGVMGAGLALQFKKRFPAMFDAYKKDCEQGIYRLGQVRPHILPGLELPRVVLNFPTKDHWKGTSRIQDIREGLKSLRDVVKALKLQSIAVPALGCGLGQLSWNEVGPAIVTHLDGINGLHVTIYPPRL